MPFDETVTISEMKLSFSQICQQLQSAAVQSDCPGNQMEKIQSLKTYNADPKRCSFEGGSSTQQQTNDTATAATRTPLPCWNPSPWHNTSPLQNAFTCFKAVHLWNSSTNEETTPRELVAYCEESSAINCNSKEVTSLNTGSAEKISSVPGILMQRFSKIPILSTFLAGSNGDNGCEGETICDKRIQGNDNSDCPTFVKAPLYPKLTETPLSEACVKELRKCEEEPSGSTTSNKLNVQNCCWGGCYPYYGGCGGYSCCDPCWPRTAMCGNISPCFNTSAWCQKSPCWNLTPWCYNNSCCNQCLW